MKRFLSFTLVLIILSGCAALDKTPWKHEAGAYTEFTVRWLRMEGSGFVDQDGICTIQAVDSEEGLESFHAQAEKCWAGTAKPLVATAQMRAIQPYKVRMYAVSSISEAEDYFIGEFGMPSFKFLMRHIRNIAGFQFNESDWCGIVIARPSMHVLGHEFKHCVDGEFHFASQRWKTAGKAFVPDPDLTLQASDLASNPK